MKVSEEESKHKHVKTKGFEAFAIKYVLSCISAATAEIGKLKAFMLVQIMYELFILLFFFVF